MLTLIQAVFNSKILDKYSYNKISDVHEKLLKKYHYEAYNIIMSTAYFAIPKCKF